MTVVHQVGQRPVVDGSHLDAEDLHRWEEIKVDFLARQIRSPRVPLVGERMLVEDAIRRVAHVWRWEDTPLEEISVQPTDPHFGHGSTHVGIGGASYSGALDSGIRLPRLTLVWPIRQEPARFWMWHHGQMRAHNGVDVWVPVRTWRAEES